MFSFEGWRLLLLLDVLYGGRDKYVNCHFWKKLQLKNVRFFVLQNPGSGSAFILKCWIQNRYQLIRIRNTGGKLPYPKHCSLGQKNLPSLVDSTSGLKGRVSSSSEGTWEEPARYTLFLESRRLMPAHCCCWDTSSVGDPDPDPLVRGTVRIRGSGSVPKCHGSQTLDTRLDTTRTFAT